MEKATITVGVKMLEQRLKNAIDILNDPSDIDGKLIALSIDRDSYKFIAEEQAKLIQGLKEEIQELRNTFGKEVLKQMSLGKSPPNKKLDK